MLDPFRSSLAPKTIEALVCTQSWLRSSPVSLLESYLDPKPIHTFDHKVNLYSKPMSIIPLVPVYHVIRCN